MVLTGKSIWLAALIASPLSLVITSPTSAEPIDPASLAPSELASTTCELDSYPFCNQESNYLITSETGKLDQQISPVPEKTADVPITSIAPISELSELSELSGPSDLNSFTSPNSFDATNNTNQPNTSSHLAAISSSRSIDQAPQIDQPVSTLTIEIDPALQVAPIATNSETSASHKLELAIAPNTSQTGSPNQNQIADSLLVQADDAPLIPVREIVVEGNTVIPPEEIDALTEPLVGQSVSLAELQAVADQITQLYLNNNYITSRAFIPNEQDINDGSILIQVIEGKLENIEVSRIDGADGRLRESYVRSRVGLGVTEPLNFARLEQELQLLKADPLIQDIRANLKAGSQPGQSILEVRYSEAKAYNIGVSFDNYGNAATGIYQGAISFQHRNLSTIGDQFFASYQRSGDANSYRASYQIPVSPSGGTVAFSFSTGVNPVTETPIAPLNIQTDSTVYELTYRQPFVRTPREEFALRLGLAFERSNSFLDGRSFNFQSLEFDDGKSQSTVLRLGQDYIRRDPRGAWALRSTFNFGVDVFGATSRDNSPDGQFFSWNGQVLRVQRLGLDRDTLAIFRVGAQLSGDSLLPINRYSIGGPFSVRGYRQNQLSGDSGVQGSVEFQFPIAKNEEGVSVLKLLPFVEAGTIWNSSFSNPDRQTLVGIGSGLMWQPSDIFTFRVDYGIPLIEINNATNNLQDDGLYFSVRANF
ncbi:Polypeptide-transport-associated domain protein ShlB-type [Thalassoporum mexicanum PCC 7367]|nr:Polypeptide-transport-associated domain protein ShlB-type [Pseudanabaena sp. PCC 7367]